MTEIQKRNLLIIANFVELNKRVLKNLVGNDLSTKVDGQDVETNAEIMVTTKLRERLIAKVG